MSKTFATVVVLPQSSAMMKTMLGLLPLPSGCGPEQVSPSDGDGHPGGPEAKAKVGQQRRRKSSVTDFIFVSLLQQH